MRKFFEKWKARKTVDNWVTEPSRKVHPSQSSSGAAEAAGRTHFSSYSEVPMILDWQAPIHVDPNVKTFYPGSDKLEPLPQAHRDSAESMRHAPSPILSRFPLHVELMYLIIDNYLSEDTKTLLNLGKAVQDLRHHCWGHAFRSVKVVIRQREIDRKKEKSNVDLFLQLISTTPVIFPYVRELDIQDRGRMVWHQQGLASTSQEDLTTLSLLLVQTQRMKLKSFKITSSLVWSTLPIHVKEALFALFTSRTLSEISLSGILLPVNLLALIRNLRVVDFQTGGVGPPIFHPSVAFIKPKQVDALKIRDRNPFSNPMSVLGFSDQSFKPFSLAHLNHLEICLPGKHLSTVEEGLRLCQSLEVLKVFVGTAGGLPHPLTLSCLTLLKSLTLAADITNILDSAIRFDWVVDILESIPPTSLLQDITILIRTPNLEQGKQCDWALFDSLFQSGDNARWSHLRLLKIVWCTARSQDIQENQNDAFIQHLPIFMPNLHRRGILKMQATYSDTHYNFWTFT